MEARLVDALPSGSGWQFEPKWDGFRCLASREGARIQMSAKSGKTLARYFPEMVEHLAALPLRNDGFVLDGELAIPVGSTLDFEALQLRLHPAESRIRKLARETPAIFIVFDLLIAPSGKSLIESPLTERRAALESFFAALGPHPALRLSPCTRQRSTAQSWLNRAAGALDGVVAKRFDEPYTMGERGWLKVKRLRTADCVVGGFRYATDSSLVGSLLLGLYDEDGLLHHVGFTSGIANDVAGSAHQEAGETSGTSRLHRERARRAQSLVDRAHRTVGAAEIEARRRGPVRSCHRRSLPPRHAVSALAPR